MFWVILFLLLCNIIAPLAFVMKLCVSNGKIEFNHVLLFSVGYLVYWISPLAVGESHLFTGSVGMTLWYGLFDRIPQATIALYLLMSLGIYGAFGGGVLLCRYLYPARSPQIRRFFFDYRLLNVFLLVGLVAAAAYIILLRGEFFRGYTSLDIDTNVGPRGSLIATSIFLLSLALLYSLKQQEKFPNISFRSAITNHFFVIYFLIALLVLSLGGRLYFFSSVVMLLVYRSVYFQKIGYRPFVLFITATLTLAGAIGTLRLGTAVSIDNILFNLIVEPLFNSFSLLQYLTDGRFSLVNAPIFLLGDFTNLIPTALFPGKAAFLLSPDDYGYHTFSPFGSLNTFFAFMINFGIIGTMLFMFLLGFLLNLLRSRGFSLLSRTIYIMVCGWLPTTFFRDPFSVSIVKSIFEYSIVSPTLVVVSAGLVTHWLVDRSRWPPPPETVQS